MPFLTEYWKPILAAVILVAGIAAFSHSRYTAGERAGRAAVQADWDKATLAAKRAYDEAAAATAAKNEANRKVAEEVERGLREKVVAADAGGRDLARRLRDELARSAARCRALSRATAPAGEPAGPSGGAGSDEAIGRATEEVFAACSRDAARLDAWNAWADSIYPLR